MVDEDMDCVFASTVCRVLKEESLEREQTRVLFSLPQGLQSLISATCKKSCFL
jgi:hypothetical protein